MPISAAPRCSAHCRPRSDWTAGVPSAVFGGDTLHVFAGFSRGKPGRVRLVARRAGGEHETLAHAAVAPSRLADGSLPRMAAAARLADMPDDEALALALKH